jgi:hypothetical protein
MQILRKLFVTAVLALGAAAVLPVTAQSRSPFSQPYSIILTDNRQSSDPNVIPVIINRVNDQTIRSNPNEAVVPPGPQRVVVDVPPRRGFRLATQNTMDLVTEPCMRYFVNARLDNKLTQGWEPFVRSTERIGECERRFNITR